MSAQARCPALAPAPCTGEASPPSRAAVPPSAQRGTALLLAMIILALVATLASALVWQQERAIRIEAAERARIQSAWILAGALDWARLILREDQRTGGVDHLGEPWAVPLAEARLSTFLAADRGAGGVVGDDGPEAFLSGRIQDEQARYNVANVVDAQGKPVAAEIEVLQRLCTLAGLSSDVATRIADGLVGAAADPATVLRPQRFEQLTWLGLDAASVARLEPYATLLPQASPVNVNTASREVLAAVIGGIDLSLAERLVQRRASQPFRSIDELRRELPTGLVLPENRVGVGSRFFEVAGRLRLEQRVLETRALVQRQPGGNVVALWQERRSLSGSAP